MPFFVAVLLFFLICWLWAVYQHKQIMKHHNMDLSGRRLRNNDPS